WPLVDKVPGLFALNDRQQQLLKVVRISSLRQQQTLPSDKFLTARPRRKSSHITSSSAPQERSSSRNDSREKTSCWKPRSNLWLHKHGSKISTRTLSRL